MSPSNLHNMLPQEYTVGPNDVIIGRGKKCTENPGNKRFKAIIQATLTLYSNAPTKLSKSQIIMQVLTQVRADNGAGFVKQAPNGRYIQVEEAASRIAIAQAFRDALSGSYKSSKKHKQIRRLQRKKTQEMTLATAAAINSSTCFHQYSLTEQPLIFGSQETTTFCNSSAPTKPSPFPSVLPTTSTNRRNSISMFQIRDILNEATNLAFEWDNVNAHEEHTTSITLTDDDFDFMNSEPAASTTTTDDVFSMLLTAFGGDNDFANDTSCDPFEPTPIAEEETPLPFYYNACAVAPQAA